MAGPAHLLLLLFADPAVGLAGGVRVNKVFAAAFSRREADRVVAAGRVLLNGRVATAGDRVCPGDALLLDGEPFTPPRDAPASDVNFACAR